MFYIKRVASTRDQFCFYNGDSDIYI